MLSKGLQVYSCIVVLLNICFAPLYQYFCATSSASLYAYTFIGVCVCIFIADHRATPSACLLLLYFCIHAHVLVLIVLVLASAHLATGCRLCTPARNRSWYAPCFCLPSWAALSWLNHLITHNKSSCNTFPMSYCTSLFPPAVFVHVCV